MTKHRPTKTTNPTPPDNAKWKRPAAIVGEHVDTDAPPPSSASEITEDDLRERSKALDEAQESWEEVAYMANPKMPCVECGGTGTMTGGSLGDFPCPRCNGARVLEQPGRRTVQQPAFGAMREAITAYGDALADRLLPDGHRAKRGLALPAPETVPSIETLRKFNQDAIDVSRQLTGAPGLNIDPKQLPEAKKSKGLAGDGELGEYSDAELAEMEAEKR